MAEAKRCGGEGLGMRTGYRGGFPKFTNKGFFLNVEMQGEMLLPKYTKTQVE
jgi:hypothetical protein